MSPGQPGYRSQCQEIDPLFVLVAVGGTGNGRVGYR